VIVTAPLWAASQPCSITIRRSRVLVNAQVIEKSPKSARSARVLPLIEPVMSALAELQARQRDEELGAGPAYAGSGYVAADELGAPLYPERLTDWFAELCRAAGVPPIRLHDLRGTLNGLLERGHVPDSARAAWLGHSVQVNRTAYLAAPSDLSVAGALIGDILRTV
jgi:integrase